MTHRPNRVASIIVAAGEGTRMGSQPRKQYMMLGKRPVLAHTILAFEQCNLIEEIFVVIPVTDDLLCSEEIIAPLKPRKPVHLISGDATRQASVYNGLLATDARFDVVVIHDGVRPFVKPQQIEVCIRVAEEHGSCILALAATDTIKTVDEDDRVIATMRRSKIRMAQTPQAFSYNLILRAHDAARNEGYVGTDDAELAERCGESVKVMPGDPYNIKITTPEDLRLAEVLMLAFEPANFR
ncbi:MAG: 2-C-methyl-D-erythritol 4-phosphate cytidylyltransferase [Deltaproteobacteria bacterium]